ncbi:hypothetical protein [Photobacterium sp. OFAV2-7]|uniref:hypothetical protein n=1 Tax=Photobacterium sp. OFAV2-7 TaxID=2917748 RepID=UPI001EF6EBD6|nr:hypothetical protein [Photobacterium sp. OFAV2-7]MCG7585831.1 hypothetical protein [Photobacterium sp. OFAV2-7]
MKKELPQDGNVEIGNLNGYELIGIKYSDTGHSSYFSAVFMLLWLGGWFLGFKSALTQLLDGQFSLFLMFWLSAWTVAGVLVVCTIIRLFRKPVPEKILLNKPSLSIDTGIPPFRMNDKRNSQMEYIKDLFAKSKRFEISAEEIKSLSLRESEKGNRLTVDKGAHRIEIAKSATEIEREWLYNHIKQNYS